jgi:hypothetical protein
LKIAIGESVCVFFRCKTLFDVPPADLAFMDPDVMRKKLL